VIEMWRASCDGTRWARTQLIAACAALLVAPALGCGGGEEPSEKVSSEPVAASPAAAAVQPDDTAVEIDVAETAEISETADGAEVVEVEEVVVESEPAQPELAAATPALPDVAAPPPAAAAPQARTHTVQRGETLRLIAEHYYGSRNRADEIYQANRSTLADPNRIQVGQVLAIP
jgi:nucleoid-associated protein YgaU